MTDQTPQVDIHIDRSAGPEAHGWTVLGTLLAVGALGMLAWAISAAGMLDLAATGATMFLVQLTRSLFTAGIISLPEKKGSGNFSETAGFLKTASREFAEWQAKSPIWRHAALALGYTVVFLLLRLALATALGIFSNPWVAGAAAAALASVIVAPGLIGTMIRNLKTKSGVKLNTTKED